MVSSGLSWFKILVSGVVGMPKPGVWTGVGAGSIPGNTFVFSAAGVAKGLVSTSPGIVIKGLDLASSLPFSISPTVGPNTIPDGVCS